MKFDSGIEVDSFFLDKDSGVSAVIGVILMVAVTAALATTVYIYVSSMPSPAEPVSTVVQAEYSDGELDITHFGGDSIDDAVYGFSSQGLVSHWSLDNGSGNIAYDEAGDNDGTIQGASWTVGKIESALEFDGVNDYVRVNNGVSGISNSPELSISLWINSPFDINESGNGDTDYSFQILIGQGSSWSNTIYLVKDQDNELVPEFRYEDGTSDRGNCDVDLNPYKNEWTHITYVFRNSKHIIYINGEKKAEEAASKSVTPNIQGDDLDIANLPFSGREFSKATIDSARIYNRALSQNEIERQYKAGWKNLVVKNNGTPISITNVYCTETNFSAGDTLTINQHFQSGDQISIVYKPAHQTIKTYTIP